MRIRNILSVIIIITLLSSCKEKKEEAKVVAEPVIEEVVNVEPVVEEPEPVVEEVIEAPKERVFVVQEGQWLYDIAREEYGSSTGWEKIYEANKEKISNPDIIYPNQELIIPE